MHIDKSLSLSLSITGNLAMKTNISHRGPHRRCGLGRWRRSLAASREEGGGLVLRVCRNLGGLGFRYSILRGWSDGM